MAYSILWAREKFFYNRLANSSHLQFVLMDGYAVSGSSTLYAKFTESGNEIYRAAATYSSGTKYYDTVFRWGGRRLVVAGSSNPGINGEYVESTAGGATVYLHDDNVSYCIIRANGRWGVYSYSSLSDLSNPSGLSNPAYTGLSSDSTAAGSIPPAKMYAPSSGSGGSISDGVDMSNGIRAYWKPGDDSMPSGEHDVVMTLYSDSGYGSAVVSNVPVGLTYDDFYCVNADYYGASSAPDCFDDGIAYSSPKTLELPGLPGGYEYSVQVRRLSSASTALPSPSTRRRVFDSNANMSSAGVSAASCSLSSHPCANYIVEACKYEDNGQDYWRYRLYEAVHNGKGKFAQSYLTSIAGSSPWSGTPFQTGERIMQYDSTNGCWAVSDSSNNLVGCVADYCVYDGSSVNVSGTNVGGVAVYADGEASAPLYRTLYSTGGTLSMGDFLAIDGACEFTDDGLMKGRLLSVVDGLQFGSAVSFGRGGRSIMSFAFAGNAPNGLKSIECSVQDPGYVPPYDAGCWSFGWSLASSGDRSMAGKEVMMAVEAPEKDGEAGDYLLESTAYMNGLYCVTAFAVADGGDISLPFIEQSMPMSYFEEPLVVSFGRKSTAYAKSSTAPANARFTLSYRGVPVEGMFAVSKMEVSKQMFENEIQHVDDFIDYPQAWDVVINGGSPDEAGVSYGSDGHAARIPFGAAPDLVREYIKVPETVMTEYGSSQSIGGNYELMSYDEVNALIGTGYTESDYAGDNRIYVCTGLDNVARYIRKYGSQWIISVSASPENSSYIIQSVTYNEDPAKALCSYVYAPSYVGPMPSYDTQTGVFVTVPGETEHGKEKTLYVRFSDDAGNTTAVASCAVAIYMVAPSDVSVKLFGSDGDTHYTGFYKKHGRFFPCEYVTVSFSAVSQLDMKYKICGENLMVPDGDPWRPLESGTTTTALVRVCPGGVKSASMLNRSSNIRVYLAVMDEAGNSNVVTWSGEGTGVWNDGDVPLTTVDYSSIYYLSRLFRTEHENLVPVSDKSQSVMADSGNSLTLITRKSVSVSEYTRSWNEIWYPSNHGSPLNNDGSINVVEAMRIAKDTDPTGVNGPTEQELQDYDRLAIGADGNLTVDSDGRYVNASWNRSKTYPGMENNRVLNNAYQKYWIIDNTGNSDFRLEFEIFDFSTSITTLPANLVAPSDGDMLCVYDASDPAAVTVGYDKYGNTKYTLADSSKLSLLFILKGSGMGDVKTYTMVDSKVDGELTDAGQGFITPSIPSSTRICLVPFTDYGDSGDTTASGFKLKAGPSHAVEYSNYDSIDETGEFWIHWSPAANGVGMWSSPEDAAIDYFYYRMWAETDYDRGVVKFDNALSHPLMCTFNCFTYLYDGAGKFKTSDGSGYLNVSNVAGLSGNQRPYGYFSYYNNANDSQTDYSHCIRTFAGTEDDYVDYYDPSFYVSPSGYAPSRNGYYSFSGGSDSGKLPGVNMSMNKDTGILEFTRQVPLGRMFGDYYHHTFYRLTSDGYGDLYFYNGGVLVPAQSTSNYKDWTYVDVKIVNEGTNSLYSGTLKFLARGYITKGTVVDVVLDMNRPWDVQEGTTAETVKRTGGVWATSYSLLNSTSSMMPTRGNAFEAAKSQDVVFGTLAPKQTIYARIFWCIANDANGTSWVQTSRGSKTYSAELSGTYFIISL